MKLWPGQRRAARQLHRGLDADADADADTDADTDADADADANAEGLNKIEEQCKELEIDERDLAENIRCLHQYQAQFHQVYQVRP